MRKIKSTQVYLLKSLRGEGYKVVTFDEVKKTTFVATNYLHRDEAEGIVQKFILGGCKPMGVKHESDMV